MLGLNVYQVIKITMLKYREALFWLAIILIMCFAFLSVKNIPSIVDEWRAFQQISWFLHGNFHTTHQITMFPTYHGIIAAVSHVFGGKTLSDVRFISFLGSCVGIWVFYLLVRRLWPEEKYIRTTQFVFFPILFPFFFLLYTDAWSLAFVLIAVERALARHLLWSATAIGMAVLIRQPNIFWAVFVWLLFLEDIQWDPLHIFQWIKSSLLKTWPFLLIFFAFGVFVVANGGVVAQGDIEHQHATINLSNIWFFCLLFTVLFFPNSIGFLQRQLPQMLRQNTWVAPTIFLVGMLLFWLTYRVSHPYNQLHVSYWLRNRILYWTTYYPLLKMCAGILACWGAFVFVTTPLAEKRFWSLSCITFASIVVMPLIEQRYYLIPMILFLAFRKIETMKWEIFQTNLYITASFLLLSGIVFGWYFL